MNNQKVDLAIIIPAFNEAQSIQGVIEAGLKKGIPIVIDDGSSDETAQLAKIYGAHVVSHKINKGYEAAIHTGICEAIKIGCKFAITMDADGQHDPAILDTYIKAFDDGADLIVGQRDCTQRWSEAVFSIIGQYYWGLKDPLCGMKGYRLTSLPLGKNMNTYKSVGTEIAIRMAKSQVNTFQPAILTRKRLGKSRFGGGFRANWLILKALLNGIFI